MAATLVRATDIVGGYEAWRAAGLPVVPGGTLPGSYVAAAPSPISLDPGGQRLLVDGAPVALTPLEFRLLTALLRGNGRVITREDLRSGLGEWAGSRSRSVDLHIHRKLGPRAAALLTTERGSASGCARHRHRHRPRAADATRHGHCG
ncbi:winged helix-turn-helix domain-containing protein [Streptomyces sp. NPDC048254]|uniref:winged helix-turn-helix domain-containing protein n=1 Tax=Streptomyces sp. NPDC048254 TaxID=3365525 RepID=UPI0037138822